MRRKLTTLLAGLSGLIIVDAPVSTAIVAAAVRQAGVCITALGASAGGAGKAAEAYTGALNNLALTAGDFAKCCEEFVDAEDSLAYVHPTGTVSRYATRASFNWHVTASWWWPRQSPAGARCLAPRTR